MYLKAEVFFGNSASCTAAEKIVHCSRWKCYDGIADDTDANNTYHWGESWKKHGEFMVLKYKKSLYPKIAVIKAAYHFTDVAYLHLDSDEEYYIVEITPKAGCCLEELDFENQILAQTARNEIFKQTKDIREIALARALASSIIENTEDTEDMNESIPADQILHNWFDINE